MRSRGVGFTMLALVGCAVALFGWQSNAIAPSGHAGVAPVACAAAVGAQGRGAGLIEAVAVRAGHGAIDAPPSRVPAASEPLVGAVLVHVRHADGSPCVGMRVTARAPGDDDMAIAATAVLAVTDEMGDARFVDLAPGEVLVEADARSSRQARVEVLAGGQVATTLQMRTGGTVRGVVLDPHGQPVPHANVVAARWSAGEHRQWNLAQCDPAGRFEVGGIDGTMLLGARQPGFAPSPLRFVMLPPVASQEVRIQLGGEAAALSGVVIDAAGQPVGDALVAIGAASVACRLNLPDDAPGVAAMPAIARTDAQGRFAVADLVPAVGTAVTVRSPAGLGWVGNTDLVAGGRHHLAIRLVAEANLVGTVTAGDGSAVAGAALKVQHRARPFLTWSCTTQKDGSYRCEALPGVEVDIEVDGGELGRGTVTAELRAAAETRVDVQLPRLRRLSGRVVDGDGRAVAEGVIEVVSDQRARRTRTDGEGRFCIEGFAGAKLWLRATAPAPRESLTVTRAFAGNELDSDLLVTLDNSQHASARLQACAVDERGAPLASATVFVRAPGGLAWLSHRASAEGKFELGPFPPGQVMLRFQAPGRCTVVMNRTVAAAASLDLGEIRLLPTAKLEVALLRADGQPVRNADVRVLDSAGEFQTLVGWHSGAACTTDLGPGTWVVTVAVPGCALASQRVEIQSTQARRIEFALQAGIACRLQLPELPAGCVDRSIHLQGPNAVRQVLWWNDTHMRPQTAELCLPPGDYVLSRGDGAGREFRFTVPFVGAVDVAAEF